MVFNGSSLSCFGWKVKRESKPMVAKFTVIKEDYRRWKGKNGPGESYDIVLEDASNPRRHALSHHCRYALTEDEKALHWGKLQDKTVEIVINEVQLRDSLPTLRGALIVPANGK